YKLPATVRTVVGPMNSMQDFAMMSNGDYVPDFLGTDFIGISLQFYLGENFSLYNTEYFINNVAPLYRSRRFTKAYIISDVMKLITEDIFPDKSKGKPLIEQMIEKGKQWWMMDKFLPEVPDSIKTYIGEGPFTQGFSQELSPGNLGQWIGWQIVKKFANNNKNIKPENIMQTPARKILEEAKYKPK